MEYIRNRLRYFDNSYDYFPINEIHVNRGDDCEEEDSIDIVERFEKFVNNDASQYEYFRIFFELKSYDVFYQLTTPAKLFSFLNDVFINGNDIQQFNSLILINLLLQLKDVDLSFWKNMSFLEHVMEMLKSDNKICF